MSEIDVQDLRTNTDAALRRVETGESITITSRGRAVAELVPFRQGQRRPIARAELVRRLDSTQADAGLREELARLNDDDTL